MLGYCLQAYIIWQTDCKASSTVCSLLISAAQSTWHLRGSVRKPSSLHTLGMTIASSHTSSFMADDLRLYFPSAVLQCLPGTTSCGKLWMKTEWNARKTFYNFHILLYFTFVEAAADGKLDLSAASSISQLLSRHRPLSGGVQIGRLVEQLASNEKREQLQQLPPLPFRHWSLARFSCFSLGN